MCAVTLSMSRAVFVDLSFKPLWVFHARTLHRSVVFFQLNSAWSSTFEQSTCWICVDGSHRFCLLVHLKHIMLWCLCPHVPHHVVLLGKVHLESSRPPYCSLIRTLVTFLAGKSLAWMHGWSFDFATAPSTQAQLLHRVLSKWQTSHLLYMVATCAFLQVQTSHSIHITNNWIVHCLDHGAKVVHYIHLLASIGLCKAHCCCLGVECNLRFQS